MIGTIILIFAILAAIVSLMRLFNRDMFGAACAALVAAILFVLM